MRQPAPTPESMARAQRMLRVCETCPFLIKNHRKKHAAKWYAVGNLRRLWNGIRTGRAPGMICHSSDPDSASYGGSGNIRPGHEADCAGALLLVLANMNAISADRPQPFQPPLTKPKIADVLWLYLTGSLPKVEDRVSEVGLPWQSKS